MNNYKDYSEKIKYLNSYENCNIRNDIFDPKGWYATDTVNIMSYLLKLGFWVISKGQLNKIEGCLRSTAR